MSTPINPTDEELAQKYADQYLWLENTRQREGWGDDTATKQVLLKNLIQKALEEKS